LQQQHTSQPSNTLQRNQVNSNFVGPNTYSTTAGNGNNSNTDLEDEKRLGRYSDGQQVFVGNLSQELSDLELKQFFSQYGKVLEVRINTNTKQQSGRRLPNYGFVVFDDKQTVDTLLGATKSNNLTYKNDKGIEFRLNVEEKRARQGRMSSFGGAINKTNRVTRSSSNTSRNGNQQNGNISKKNLKDLNDHNTFGEKKKESGIDNAIDCHRNKNTTNFKRS
jgi:hypothetical protein